jgi:hypothetical protein
MPRALTAAALALALAGLPACGEDTVGRQLSHQENATGLLEANKGDPEKAAQALREYIEANREDLTAIHAEGHKLAAQLQAKPADAEAILKPHAERLRQRKLALETFYKANPELATHPGVVAAMKELLVGPDMPPAAAKPSGGGGH